MIGIFSKLISESLLSLYPIIVKKINLPIIIQSWSRLFIYAIISFILSDKSFIFKNIFTINGLLLSLINTLHIFFSFQAFKIIDSGLAYSLFYLYPIFILLINYSNLFLPIFLFGFSIFIIFLYKIFVKNEKETFLNGEEKNNIDENNYIKLKGFVYIILAALTEAMIYFFVKKFKTNNYWNVLFIAYLFGAIILTIMNYKEININIMGVDRNNILILLLLNGILGTIGYFLRFYSINKISIILFSILSYFGIIMAYLYGYIFNNEKLTLFKSMITIIIILLNLYIIFK
jgi:drug/metabolite transporter (DMT)-like permease